MTRRAACRDSRVVIARGSKDPICSSHTVTRIAGGRRDHMVSRLPAGLHPVVTGQAGAWRDALMFEGRPCPAHGTVAAIACHGCRDMGGRLALRDALVMTPGARSRSHTVVGKKRGPPTCRPVAGIAIGRRG